MIKQLLELMWPSDPGILTGLVWWMRGLAWDHDRSGMWIRRGEDKPAFLRCVACNDVVGMWPAEVRPVRTALEISTPHWLRLREG